MNNFFRFLQIFALGTWVGCIIFLSFVVAPGAFTLLSSPDQAGGFVGFALTRLHVMGVVAGLLFLLATFALGKSAAVLVRPAAIVVALMIILTSFSQWHVRPRMDHLRQQMGSVMATPPSTPLRAEFDKLHGVSVKLEVSVLVLGLVGLFLTARPLKP